MIRFEGVNKVFGDGTVAVADLDLELPAGRISVLVGPSGCGKTTSLRMVNRLVTPTSGRVLLDGRDVATQDETTLRRHIGYVIQHAGLFPHRTVLDNVATVPRLLGWDKAKARARAAEMLDLVGLDAAYARRYPSQLSGGQQQRVGVARALAADPPVMLMDEPFSAVDPVVRGALQQEFLRLQRELGTTIALVTHDIDEAVTLGDQVAVFREGGHLAQVGTPEDLLTAPADDFVASFVGRDRGWRSLSFLPAGELTPRPLPAELRLDADGRPLSWATATGEVAAATFGDDDSVRQAADLAISSPTGYAVHVDDTGRATGVVSHANVAGFVAARRRGSARGTATP